MLATVEKELLSPLGNWLENVIDGEQGKFLWTWFRPVWLICHKGGHGHSIMPLISLQMGLKRIQEAKLDLESNAS